MTTTHYILTQLGVNKLYFITCFGYTTKMVTKNSTNEFSYNYLG